MLETKKKDLKKKGENVKKWIPTVPTTIRNSFSRGFPLPFNMETLQAFGALFQIPQYYRKFLYYKTKMFM
jgi:hypothetical protein